MVLRRQALVDRCCNRRVAVCNNLYAYWHIRMYVHGTHNNAAYTKQLIVSAFIHCTHEVVRGCVMTWSDEGVVCVWWSVEGEGSRRGEGGGK